MILKTEKIQLEYSDNEGYFKEDSFEMKSDDEQFIIWIDIEVIKIKKGFKAWYDPEIIISVIDVMDIEVGEVISRMDLKELVIENLIID